MRISILVISTGLLLGASFPAEAQQTDVTVNGYFDIEAKVSNKDAVGKRWTFDQHHLNFITTYKINQDFRLVTEIEWEHTPSLEKDEFTGKIYLARSFLEHNRSDQLRFRIGKFLIPFGIYNELHDATPTFVFTVLPSSFYGKHELSAGAKDRFFARNGVGVGALGRLFIKDSELAYQVFLTNGRGADPGERDDNANKAIGGRATLSLVEDKLRIGTSFYRDRNGVDNNALQQALAGELEIKLDRVRLQAEAIFPKLERTDSTGNLSGIFRTPLAYYVQGQYDILDRFIGFGRYEFFRPDTDNKHETERAYVVGLNYALTLQAFLKGEVHFNRFEGMAASNYEFFTTSIAVAF